MHTYKVTVRTPSGELLVRRDTREAALETGLVLQREGMGEITITPPNGKPLPLAALIQAEPAGGEQVDQNSRLKGRP